MKTENTFIIHPETAEQEDALKAFVKAHKMKFEVTNQKPYDPDFVAKIQKSRKQAKEGKLLGLKRMNYKILGPGMNYHLDFTDKAKKDIAFFKKSGSKPVLKKIFVLLNEIAVHPYTGT